MRNTIKFEVGKTYEGYGDVKGVNFELLKREGDICLFKRDDGFAEVIELRQQKASTSVIAGKEVEFKEKEIYPYGESWQGSCTGLTKALKDFDKLVKESK